MESKDTVMNDHQILDFYYKNRKEDISEKALLEAQAEISFKAGRRSGILDMEKQVADAYKGGIREVVENSLQFRVAHREMLGDVGEWAECQDIGRFLYIPEAKQKEWGIK